MAALLRKNILATLTYYDVLDYPLTAFEVRKYLMNYHQPQEVQEGSQGQGNLDGGNGVALQKVREKLAELEREGEVATKEGFWFLPGREHVSAERIAREKISVGKLKRMRNLVVFIRYLPFIRMVAATGSLSLRHGTKGSDWDMFIVLEEKALFTGRLILTLFLQFIGKRRHGVKIVDRACLNYFTGSQSLTVRLQDWYAAHEYQVMIPLFQTFATDTFYRANGWLLHFRNQVHMPVTAHRLQLADTKAAKTWRRHLERILYSAWLEKKASLFQKKKIARNPATAQEGACIIADEHALVFFPEPRGPKVFEQFQRRLTV